MGMVDLVTVFWVVNIEKFEVRGLYAYATIYGTHQCRRAFRVYNSSD